MKVAELTRLMNNRGTRPRIKVYKWKKDCVVLSYEGRPDNVGDEAGKLKVNSFTVLGAGYMEIYAQ